MAKFDDERKARLLKLLQFVVADTAPEADVGPLPYSVGCLKDVESNKLPSARSLILDISALIERLNRIIEAKKQERDEVIRGCLVKLLLTLSYAYEELIPLINEYAQANAAPKVKKSLSGFEEICAAIMGITSQSTVTTASLGTYWIKHLPTLIAKTFPDATLSSLLQPSHHQRAVSMGASMYSGMSSSVLFKPSAPAASSSQPPLPHKPEELTGTEKFAYEKLTEYLQPPGVNLYFVTIPVPMLANKHHEADAQSAIARLLLGDKVTEEWLAERLREAPNVGGYRAAILAIKENLNNQTMGTKLTA